MLTGLWQGCRALEEQDIYTTRTRLSPGTCKQMASDRMRGPSVMKQAVNYAKLEFVSTQSKVPCPST